MFQCFKEMSNCCSEDDLECLPADDSSPHVCRRLQSSEELAEQRLHSLQYGDSKGVMNSRPWVDSWEFQSRSAMEREEEKAAADEEFTRNFKPTDTENVWKRVYANLKSGGKNFWHDLRNLKKLREIKNKLIEKYKKNSQNNDLPESVKEETTSESPLDQPEEIAPGSVNNDDVRIPESISDDSWLYPSDTSGNTNTEHSGEGPYNQLPGDRPRRRKENRIDFRIEDVIKHITSLIIKKLNEKPVTKETSDKSRGPQSSAVEQLNRVHLLDSAERLKNEINELKALKEKQTKLKKEGKLEESINNDDLIKKQVAVILDEERKLDKLKKLEEFRKLQEMG